MDRTTILIVGLLLGMASLAAQKIPDKGVPLINNYVPQQYGQAGKIWSIRSADNGIVYFAADKGLLEFDGHRWNRFKGSEGFTRSLRIDSDSLLHTGADKDFGLWQRDSLGRFSFTSLNPFRESAKGPNEQFWGTYSIDGDLVFVSFENIYVYKSQQLTKIAAPYRFTGSFISGEKLYLADERSGLYEFDGVNLIPVFNFSASSSNPLHIIGVQEEVEGLLIITRGQGLFRLAGGGLSPVGGEVSAYLKKDQVFCFTPIDDAHYAFGTILNGVYITDKAGRIIQHINKQKGLLNNTVLSLHYSKQGKLWLGLDFGIASVDLWSDVAYFLDQGGKVGTGQAGLLHQGTFYLGTNQGLYTVDWEKLKNDVTVPDFTLVTGSSGQVWSLEVVDGEVFCGHDRGLFSIINSTMEQVHDKAGVLTIKQLDPNHLLTGDYNGISLLEKKGGRWNFVKNLPPVQGAVSQLVQENENTLWVNLPNFGVIKASLGEDLQITDQQIFPSDLFKGESPLIFQDSSLVKVMTNEAVYGYSSLQNKFENRAAPPPLHQVKDILSGKYLPDSITASHGFFPVHNGFALKNVGYKGLHPAVFPLTIRSVAAFNNDTTLLVAPGEEVSYKLNNLRIHFIVPQQNQVQYQYYLENHSTRWSSWSPESSAEFVNLPEGEYTLRVRAKTAGIIAPEKAFSLAIGPPWYRTIWAYTALLLLLFALFYLNYLWQELRLKQQKKQLAEKEKTALRLQAATEERVNLMKRYELLEDALGEIKKQLRTKTIELARKAKENDAKSRLLQALRGKVDYAQKEAKTSKFQWKQLSRLLADYPEKEDNSFSIQLEELHQDFLTNLNARFPELTSYDLRLCAYLKSGLSTKEIADLLNVLASSVNVSRSRLRKKLQLGHKEDLYKFLNTID